MAAASRWPQGLDDHAAINRLEAMMLNAADGRRSISDDRQYSTLRRVLKRGGDHRPRIPSLVATHPTLDSFSAFIRGIEDRREREKLVRADFREDGRPGAMGPAAEAASAPAPASASGAPEAAGAVIHASAWTGNPSVEQQARAVRAIGPQALAAIDTLIAEQQRRHDNGGPVDAEEKAALDALRELRTALDELIRAAEADQPIGEASTRLAALGQRALRAFTNNLGKDAGAVHAAGSTLTVSALTYALVHSVFGLPDASALVFAGFGATGFITARK